jgi:hypothetical protein
VSTSTTDPHACKAEIERAIEDLTDAQWYRLRQAGRILVLKVASLDAETLVFDALERTLSGRRRWKPSSVDFVGHLVGAMRSIASAEVKRRGFSAVALTSSVDLIGLEDPERTVSAKQQIRLLRSHFGQRDDKEALQVLDAMELGCDGPAIRSQLALDQSKLETIIRRIRRAAGRVLATAC